MRELARAAICGAVFVTGLGACSDGSNVSAVTEGITVRDSAGITIVEHSRDTVEAARVFTLAEEPTLEIGRMDGPPEHLFSSILHAVSLSDGAVAVLAPAARELRLFEADVSHRVTAGGEGGGPGEFRAANGLIVGPADSIYVWDGTSRRMSVFDHDGHFSRAFVPEVSTRRMALLRVGGAGEIYGALRGTGRSGPSFAGIGWVESRIAYVRFSAMGADPDTIIQPVAGRILSRDGGMSGTPPLFGSNGTGAPSATGIWFTAGDQTEVRRFSAEGSVELVSRWEESDRTVTPDDVEALIGMAVSEQEPQLRAVVRQDLERRPVAEVFPVVSEALASPDGGLWLRRYREPWRLDDPQEWYILGPEGEFVGTARFPPDGRVIEVGDRSLLMIVPDEFDVERVRRYELVEVAGG